MKTPSKESQIIADYPLRKILRCLMFKYGDAEFPIDKCIDFIAEIVFTHVASIVQKSLDLANRRNAEQTEVFDIVIQFRRNPKLLKRLFEYVSLINASSNIRKVYSVEINDVDDEGECSGDYEETASSTLAQKVLNAVKKFDTDGKLVDFVTSGEHDLSKIERTKRIAARTEGMSVEKYQRFAEASTYSFLLVAGKRSQVFEAGFRYYTKAPDDFNHDMLILLNFCAIEMMNVVVEGAFAHFVKNFPGIARDKLGPIQLEFYKEAVKSIPSKKT